MKHFSQNISSLKNTFTAKSVNTSNLKITLHQRAKYELILITEGSGIVYIGHYEGKYEAGDIYFLGCNLPLTFNNSSYNTMNAIVVQLGDNCLGDYFLSMPVLKEINNLMQIAAYGLRVEGTSKIKLNPLINTFESATGFHRAITLLQCLEILTTEKEYVILDQKNAHSWIMKDKEPISKVIEFTLSSFQDRISLSRVAKLACMSISSFCQYFKHNTEKTYIYFLNEVRINHACKQLLETNKLVTEICYESGYGTITNFHRQFLKLNKLTPLQYKRKYSKTIKTLDNTLSRLR